MVLPHWGRYGTTQPSVLQAEPVHIVTRDTLLAMRIRVKALDHL